MRATRGNDEPQLVFSLSGAMESIGGLAFRLFVSLFAAMSAMHSTLAAARDDICSDSLIRGVTYSSNDSYYAHAYYRLFNTDEEFEKQKSAGGSGDVLGLISGSANYGEFERMRAARLEINSDSMTTSQAQRLFTSAVPEENLRAWLDCMRDRGSKNALIAYLKDISDETATLVIDWRPAPGVPRQKLKSAFARGVLSETSPQRPIVDISNQLPATWEESVFSLLLARESCAEMHVAITIGPYSDSVFAPACPEKLPTPVRPPIRIDVFPVTSPSGNRPTAKACVPRGWKLIGGGAEVIYGDSPGLLLTASYPEDSHCWRSDAKDHSSAANGTVTAYAIGLYDPGDAWDVRVDSTTTNSAVNHPSVSVELPPEFALTGCGGRIDWKGHGSLLTGVYPSGRSACTTSGKDHSRPDKSRATSFAIGIRPRNGSTGPISRLFTTLSDPSSRPSGRQGVDAGCVLAGGGARIDWENTPGVLLTSSKPDDQSWSASGKDHSVPASAPMSIYGIGICE